jgi:hypothetical protein
MPASEDKNVFFPSKSLGRSPKGCASMTDTNFAADLLHETFPLTADRPRVKAAIGSAFAALKALERKLPNEVLSERQRRWTERRVRALWTKEARRVDHYEIQDLAAVAVEEARLERQRLQARQDRLAALIAASDAGEDREIH